MGNTNSNAQSAGYATSVAIIGGLFFVFGFVTWLNGPLIIFVKLAFNLDTVGAFLVPMAFYLSYLFLALPSAGILRITGMKRGMGLGLLVMAAGAALFGEFATLRVYPGALSGLFVLGAGLALLQTAVNPYISILGPIESAAQRIAVMGICNKGAGILAPFVIGTLVLNGINTFEARLHAADSIQARSALLDAFAAHIQMPYFVMAAVLVILALVVVRSPLPDVHAAEANRMPTSRDGAARPARLTQFPHLWLGVLCLFLYVGVEVMAGDAIGTYGLSFHLPLEQTRFFTSLTLTAMLMGYLVGLIATPRLISQQRYLSWSAVLGILFVIGAYLTHSYVSVGFVAALGFANAMMWPAIFPLAIKGLGHLTEQGSAFMIMAIAGGAVLPQLFAHLMQYFNFQLVFLLLMAPCYLYILYYSLYGHRVGLAAHDTGRVVEAR
ncbi:sugar MFS transporter [Metallibacterium sp.]|uniref:sugar MFS transporter n=1 Tax=Metallibacterium sp. TaxID=2940281 RepID=UPI00262DFDC9|nr:sugar MFS transporter [Metallibacterium sp.]